MTSCSTCAHYGDFGGRGGGTPPWPTCRFQLRPETCGRWAKGRDMPSWDDAPASRAPEAIGDEVEQIARIIDDALALAFTHGLHEPGLDPVAIVRAALRDKPPVPAEGVVERVERETAALIEYIANYVMSTEGADYIPTEWERELIEDALCGWESERAALAALRASEHSREGKLPATGDEG